MNINSHLSYTKVSVLFNFVIKSSKICIWNKDVKRCGRQGVCYVMFLLDVAVLEHDSHPDLNKRPDPYSALVLKPNPFIDPNPTS